MEINPALYWSDSLKSAEARALASLPELTLMNQAAHELANVCAIELRRSAPGRIAVALVGPGNNGGDALLAAIMLRERGFDARAVMLEPTAPRAADARRVYERALAGRLPITAELSDSPEVRRALCIDGLYGIGLNRPLSGQAREWVERLNQRRADVISVDIPSGIHADTGQIIGAGSGVAVRARITVTFLGDKPGLRTGAGIEHAGHVVVATLGIDPPARDGTLITGVELLPSAQKLARRRNSHKGSYGQVAILGGAAGMDGAAVLAALGAQRAGAGKVYMGSPTGRPALPMNAPQLMTLAQRSSLLGLQAIAVGCGLGLSPKARRLLDQVLAQDTCPVVADADGLNLIAENVSLRRAVQRRRHSVVVTPHPLEAARLLGVSTADVQADRIGSARALAHHLGAYVVLKGAGSVVASPSSDWAILGVGSPSLATAGTGDVLSGVIAALLAQGLHAAEAACLGAWVHARAGEIWAQSHSGEVGLSAVELPDLIRTVINSLLSDWRASP